jgi:hypothetical protein
MLHFEVQKLHSQAVDTHILVGLEKLSYAVLFHVDPNRDGRFDEPIQVAHLSPIFFLEKANRI